MRALVLVDIQNDFLPGGALPAPGGDAIIPIVNGLMDKFDLVVATRDWHPPDHVSFASIHDLQEGEVIEVDGLEQMLFPVHCVQGSRGAELSKELAIEKIAKVFDKGMNPRVDSYSGFADNGKRHWTGLGEYLKASGVTELYVAGLTTEYCIKATVLDGLGLGFGVWVVVDGICAVKAHPGDEVEALEEMEAAGATLAESEDILTYA